MLTLNDGRKELYQWDTGRKATVGIECDVVHFANLKYGESLAVEVKIGEVAIPNKLLMSGEPIYCWAFVKDESGSYTKKEQTLAVTKRAKPSDYVYTETDVITVKTAVEKALEEAKASGEFKGEKGDTGATGPMGPQGEKGDTGAAGKDGANGKDGTSVTVSSVSESTEDGGNNVVTFSDGKTLTVKNGKTGATGATGADGTSVTVSSVSESTADGGENIVTFSDGKILTVKNGSKGSKGEKGDKGEKGETGKTGADGKSAYSSAQDGGFTGTESQFNKGLSVMGGVSGIDTTVTQNSGNLITSGAVYEYATSAINRVRHYGARWNKTQAQMTRLYDAASSPTDITNFAHRGSVNPNYNNPFDKIYPWSGRKLCNIDIDAYLALTEGQSITRAVKAWEGDTDFSYTDVNGVWVYTPEFWGKSWDETVGSTEYRYFDVADKPCGGYVHYQERIEGRWHGRAQTVNIGGTDKTCLIPSVGIPARNIAMSTLHTYAKNWGATLDSIFSIDANDLLMIVEFATMNSQSAIGSGVDSMYRQSSDLISAAATESTVVKVSKSAGSALCIPGAIFDIGTTNGGTQVGSFLVVSAVTDPDDSTLLDVTLNAPVTVTTSNYWSVHGVGNSADADIGSQSGYIGTNGKSIAYYRGEELFGNMFFYILGAYRQTGTQHVFIAHDDNEADAADELNASLHIDTGIAISTTEGYVNKLGILSRSGLLCCPPFCTEKGGDSANPVGDYYYINASAGNTVLLRGGYASGGAIDGAFYGSWSTAASDAYWYFAARPRLKNP